MSSQYSIAVARHNLSALVHALEEQDQIKLTRRGKPVAVLLSMRAYERLTAPKTDFWEAYQRFRRSHPLESFAIGPEVFNDGRDTAAGREVHF
jgi:prevent-host-death family protein